VRVLLAKKLDKIFIGDILNNSNNKVGLVSYGSDICHNSIGLTNNSVLLNNTVDTYNADCGETCISCAVQKAIALLKNSKDNKFMVVMSDGEANTCINSSAFPCTYAKEEAINLSYEAFQKYGIRVYTIGFGSLEGETTLRQMATSGGGIYYGSENATELEKIYKEIAQTIVNVTYITQKISVTGGTSLGNVLYPDSYIEFEYKPETPAYEYGEIQLKFETNPFGGCNGSFFIPQQLKVDDIRRTSYSSDFWTLSVLVNNSNSAYNWKTVYNLNNFGSNYIALGDPFQVQFPSKYVISNEINDIGLILATNVTKSNECSLNDKVIYTARVKAITDFSPVLPNASGGIFRVYFNKGNFSCNPDGWTDIQVGNVTDHAVHSVEELNTANNSVQFAFSQLLDKLNFVDDSCPGPSGNATNPIDIEMTPELKLETSEISNVPSLWGPIKFELTISS
jgi:hypothetical protein